LTGINTTLDILTRTIKQEQEAGRVNSLADLAESQRRRAEIAQHWQAIQAELQPISQAIKDLPALPPEEIIAWAQSVKEMDSLAFLEVDTTGTGSDAEIIRVTLGNQRGSVLYDQLIRPEQAHLTPEASKHNGLTNADLQDAPTLAEAWPRIQRALAGRYVLSFNQEWDIKKLKAAAQRHGLPAPVVVGECLQRRCTAYYLKEYYLDLATVAARMGHTLTGPDTPARLKAQYAILDGIARGMTDIRPPEPEPVRTSASTASEPGYDDGLEDIDEHPF
jgi:DNA polymerase III epsilon subunit-like protein